MEKNNFSHIVKELAGNAQYEAVRGLLRVRLVGTEQQEIIKDIPHFEKEDLAIVFTVSIPAGDNQYNTITINNEMARKWKVSREKILADAFESAQKKNPIKIGHLSELIMFISTEGENYGAAAIFYEGALRNISELCKGKAYLLPSSVHEWVVLPAVDMSKEFEQFLKEQVKRINSSVVSPEDRLTDSVYFTDGECFKKIL